MAEDRERGKGVGLLFGGIGGTVLGVAIATLLQAKPAEAAPPEEKLNYLIELLTALIPVLAEVAAGQITLNQSLQQWLAAQGIEPGVEVSVSTPWVAGEPEEIYNNPIRSIGTFDCDKMVTWTRGKRIVFKVESSLDQACQIQLVGNIDDSINLSSNINGLLPCAANGNISVGPAWDDWHPFIGLRIITAVAPTTGNLLIRTVIQE